MKRNRKQRKARKPIQTYPTPVPVQADEFICKETLYVPEPVPVESPKPWYRFGH